MGIQLICLSRKHVGKGEIVRCEQFLLFPRCFQKQSVVDVVKTSIYGVKGEKE